MVEVSKVSKTAVVTQEKRLEAIGDLKVKCEKGVKVVCENAETLFKPMVIHSRGDWLASHEEKGQTFDEFTRRVTRNKVTAERSKVYLNITDSSITEDFTEKLLAYCSAFYLGMEVVLLVKPKGKDFMKEHDIPNRINQQTGQIQYHAGKILESTKPLIPKDAYCMLTVTMQDIYPRDSWNFVFGLAALSERTGVFSFVRYDPLFQGIDTPDRDKILLSNACGVMVHEIGHMFGLKHCIYYECTMNGSNSYQESCRSVRFLCPVCLRKLQEAINFDSVARFVALRKVCSDFGFTENVEFYDRLLSMIS